MPKVQGGTLQTQLKRRPHGQYVVLGAEQVLGRHPETHTSVSTRQQGTRKFEDERLANQCELKNNKTVC